MAILLNDNIQVEGGKHIDNKYGPYTTLASALTSIPSFKRVRGLTIGIIDNNLLKEYWFKEGTNNIDLIEKVTSASSGGTGVDTEVRSLTANWQSTYTTVQTYSASWNSPTIIKKQYKSDYYGSSAVYIGSSVIGISEAYPQWTIKKSIYSPSGTFISSVSAVNIAWTDRYNL